TRVLDAEARIIEAAGSTDAAAWSSDDVELAILAARIDGIELNAGQEELVRELATSGRRVQLALAAAAPPGRTRRPGHRWPEAWRATPDGPRAPGPRASGRQPRPRMAGPG